jgi:hypothetical protein
MYVCIYTQKYIFEGCCLLLLVGGTITFKNMAAGVNNGS